MNIQFRVEEENKINTDKKLRVNQRIYAKKVRLIGKEGEQIGVVDLKDALQQAQSSSLDLVEISPNADPPVCKIMDFGKHLFLQKKKKTEAKKKQHKVHLKELKFSLRIEEGDYNTKFKKLEKFIAAGDKVKLTVRFRGRELAHGEHGVELLRRIAKEAADFSTPEREPRFEGRQVVMVLGPKKK